MGWAIASLVLALNMLDAVLTVWLIQNVFAEELNPLMRPIVEQLEYAFIIPKMLLAACFGAAIVYAWKDFKIARIGGVFVALVYLALSAYYWWGFMFVI